jgi:alpha-L-arabinofuranosidase
LWSYAFSEGHRRALIVFNLDTQQARDIAIEFSGEVSGKKAQRWLLTADSISANNEPEHEPQVGIESSALSGFQSGFHLELPPFSMTVIEWRVE